MKKSELVLEYVKIFASWPLIVLILIIFLKAPIFNILENQGNVEIEIFGIKVKTNELEAVKEVEEKAKNLKNQLKNISQRIIRLHKINEELKANLDRKDLLILEAEKNGNRSIPLKKADEMRMESRKLTSESDNIFTQIQEQFDKTQKIINESKFEKARESELAGFNNLINDQFREALSDFENAYNIYPDYHNVDEIHTLLKNKINKLVDDTTNREAKKEVYNKLIEQYSWGMPDDVKRKMQEYLDSTK